MLLHVLQVINWHYGEGNSAEIQSCTTSIRCSVQHKYQPRPFQMEWVPRAKSTFHSLITVISVGGRTVQNGAASKARSWCMQIMKLNARVVIQAMTIILQIWFYSEYDFEIQINYGSTAAFFNQLVGLQAVAYWQMRAEGIEVPSYIVQAMASHCSNKGGRHRPLFRRRKRKTHCSPLFPLWQ